MAVTLQDLIDLGVRHAHKILIEERQPSLKHFYHLVLRNGDTALLPVAWNSEIQKQLTLLGVKKAAEKLDAVMAMGISEAWALVSPRPRSKEDSEAWLDKALRDPIRESPQRQECVMIFATDGERSIGQMLHIHRDKPGGRIVALVPNEVIASGESHMLEGRLIDILPRRTSKEDEKD